MSEYVFWFFKKRIDDSGVRILTKVCLLSFLLIGSIPHRTFPTSRNERSYMEDLELLREDYLPKESCGQGRVYKFLGKKDLDSAPDRHSTAEVDEVLAKMIEENSKTPRIPCYTIQVHIGTNRSMAFAILEKTRGLFPKAYIEYLDSNYVVRVGKKLDKLELCSEYVQMLKLFPNISVRLVFAIKTDSYADNLDLVEGVITGPEVESLGP